jgi:hypothetical protein
MVICHRVLSRKDWILLRAEVGDRFLVNIIRPPTPS